MKIFKCFLTAILLTIPIAAQSYIPDKVYYVIPAPELKHLALIQRLIQCESGGKNIKHLDSNKKFSYGILQIQQETWNMWSKESGIIGNPMNQVDAKTMANWAIESGHGRSWSCWYILGL